MSRDVVCRWSGQELWYGAPGERLSEWSNGEWQVWGERVNKEPHYDYVIHTTVPWTYPLSFIAAVAPAGHDRPELQSVEAVIDGWRTRAYVFEPESCSEPTITELLESVLADKLLG